MKTSQKELYLSLLKAVEELQKEFVSIREKYEGQGEEVIAHYSIKRLRKWFADMGNITY